MCACVYTRVWVCIRAGPVRICVYVCIHVCECVYVHVCACVYVCVLCVYVCVSVGVCVCKHALVLGVFTTKCWAHFYPRQTLPALGPCYNLNNKLFSILFLIPIVLLCVPIFYSYSRSVPNPSCAIMCSFFFLRWRSSQCLSYTKAAPCCKQTQYLGLHGETFGQTVRLISLWSSPVNNRNFIIFYIIILYISYFIRGGQLRTSMGVFIKRELSMGLTASKISTQM